MPRADFVCEMTMRRPHNIVALQSDVEHIAVGHAASQPAVGMLELEAQR